MATSFFSHAKERSATSRLDALTKTGVIHPNRRKWDFEPKAKVKANGEIPKLRPVLSHRLGEKPTGLKVTIATLRQNLIEEKNKNKLVQALRKLTTETGVRWNLMKNGALQVGHKFATKEQKAQLSALIA